MAHAGRSALGRWDRLRYRAYNPLRGPARRAGDDVLPRSLGQRPRDQGDARPRKAVRDGLSLARAAVTSVQIDERVDFAAHHHFLDHAEEDAVGAELVMVDAAAGEKGLGVGEAGRTDRKGVVWGKSGAVGLD